MNSQATPNLQTLLAENEKTIGFYYRTATVLLVGSFIAHLGFASYYVHAANYVDNAHVALFAVFNLTALVVEVFLGRVAFMLGSRAGQLRDMQYALQIAEGKLDTNRIELAAKAIMSLRRESAGLKVLDVESIVNKISGSKSVDKDAA